MGTDGAKRYDKIKKQIRQGVYPCLKNFGLLSFNSQDKMLEVIETSEKKRQNSG